MIKTLLILVFAASPLLNEAQAGHHGGKHGKKQGGKEMSAEKMANKMKKKKERVIARVDGRLEKLQAKENANPARIEALNTFKTCVTNASAREDMKACREAKRTAMKQLKAEDS